MPKSRSATRPLARTATPDGRELSLVREDGDFVIRIDGEPLMHSAGAASEELLGRLALRRLPPRAAARILVGGLGLGFTLRSVLDHASGGSKVDVVELLPAVVDWNRGPLAAVNGRALEDARVEIIHADIYDVLGTSRQQPYDVIILDVDNGPAALVQSANARLYGARGIQRLATALRPAGRAVIWSAELEPRFTERLHRAKFHIELVPAPLHAAATENAYMIYVADRVPTGS